MWKIRRNIDIVFQDNSVFGMFSEEQFYLAHAICLLLAMTSSAVNPLLYGWFNSNFRKAFLQVTILTWYYM